MRLTTKLYAQHLGWHFKKHWQVQGKRVPRDTGAVADLKKLGIAVKDVSEVLEPRAAEVERLNFDHLKPLPAPEDESHPDWHLKVCHIYGNNNVLLEGLTQAQLLTNTVVINGFPKAIEKSILKMHLPSTVDRNILGAILAANVFDAEQVKLAKVKLSDRPAYNLPRSYGISNERKNRLLINKLIMECEKLAGRAVSAQRQIIDNANFKVTLPAGEDLLGLTVTAHKMITCSRPLEGIGGTFNSQLPDLYPMKSTISIPKRHIYTTETFYPLSASLECSHPHTIFLHFDKENVGNLHGTSVTASQFQSRTLLNVFGVAAARAKQLYGESALKSLPRPITVQSVQTDGCSFHFGVFQLNSLTLDGSSSSRNYWFHQPNMALFAECAYKAGRVVLSGYNQEVFRCINAFYNHS